MQYRHRDVPRARLWTENDIMEILVLIASLTLGAIIADTIDDRTLHCVEA